MPTIPVLGTALSTPLTSWGTGYRVQVFALNPLDFRPGALVAEVSTAKNIGFGDYLNDVPEAFFTVSQDDPIAEVLAAYKGKAHLRIWRGDKVVWAGWFGMEYDATSTDVIFYGFGYLAGLFWYPSDWDQEWTGVSINTIVEDLWSRAAGWEDSMIGWIGVGQIQPPMTTSGGSTPITLPTYEKFYGRILFAMQELAALAMSDTTNQVVLEITHDTAPMFNFWANRGSDISLRLEWGGRYIQDFREMGIPADHRNQLLGVGSDSRNVLYRRSDIKTADSTAVGRRVEPILYTWVRDSSELSRVNKRRLSQAVLDDADLYLDLYANSLVPTGGRDAVYINGDRPWVKIDRGATQIDRRMLIRGSQVTAFQDGVERVRLLLQEIPGT
jgi:hypothetical protein